MVNKMTLEELRDVKRKLRRVVRRLPEDKAYTMLIYLEDCIMREERKFK